MTHPSPILKWLNIGNLGLIDLKLPRTTKQLKRMVPSEMGQQHTRGLQ